jgi:hypothetical protein
MSGVTIYIKKIWSSILNNSMLNDKIKKNKINLKKG